MSAQKTDSTEDGRTPGTLREQDLRQFTGTECWYRHSLYTKFLYTDGVQYVAEQGGAYWLLDKIFACQICVPGLMDEPFITWDLVLDDEGGGAKLICTDGNNNKLYSETILFTDFSLKSIRFYFLNNVLLLPSEY